LDGEIERKYLKIFFTVYIRVADPDLYWIRIWNPDPDPGRQKLPTKAENFLKVHVLKCWIASLES
jgi:hypothetical protein